MEKDNKTKEKLAPAEWTLVVTEKDTPQQDNGCDCGVFAVKFADYLSDEAVGDEATDDAGMTFTQQDMPAFRRKMALEIVAGEVE